MAAGEPNPTLSRWELAARLRQLRMDAGKSVEDAAAELMCSAAKISRMETAGRGAQPRDIRDLARLYGVPDAVRDELMRAATNARKPGWWQDFRSIDEQSATFVGLEDAATEMRLFENVRIPGLMQTPEATRAILDGIRPSGELSPELIADLLAVRAKRRVRLTAGELHFHVVIDEAVLRRTLVAEPAAEGDDVMVAQLDQMIDDSGRPNVHLQVVPFSAGPYPGIDGSFQIMRFPSGHVDDVVFVEGLLGSFTLDKSADVDHYASIFTDISSRFALPAEATTAWLRSLRAELQASRKKTPAGRHRPAGRQ